MEVGFWVIAGWLFTIIMSIVGAYLASNAAMNTRVYEIEKQIELLKLEMANNKEEHRLQKIVSEKQDKLINDIHCMFIRIDKSLVSMSAKLNLKADKKFIQ